MRCALVPVLVLVLPCPAMPSATAGAALQSIVDGCCGRRAQAGRALLWCAIDAIKGRHQITPRAAIDLLCRGCITLDAAWLSWLRNRQCPSPASTTSPRASPCSHGITTTFFFAASDVVPLDVAGSAFHR